MTLREKRTLILGTISAVVMVAAASMALFDPLDLAQIIAWAQGR